MSLGEQIKKMRLLKGLSQKEVVMSANIEKAQFSRIENDKTDPSYSTLEKIAKAMNCTMSELFSTNEDFKDINSIDKSLIEKVSIIENLEEDEKKGLYSIIDGLSTKQKLKQTLSNALNL
ncbi:helix-turn-helix transcriptional regulator [Flavobacterium oreochromis]|uniref:helix-turn-helix domain-containing protein n=1 Tax=Flavobacterium oreochromis TaxID=2906078 RepID=UPI001CE54083|nr:helix-turn-helix transcriptional regulator [Flavobacterium oreochromis]QYS87208.1 helix-turn-helix transcriptional regulator [Flavobacterium oreochromis]QYS87216.1 helix-turn-helix transcriptional regulator [Flavobacterium oreochromis]QYS87246.1 helix-turn-helix transcriptional regulator [Flavobacterium oreochromis]